LPQKEIGIRPGEKIHEIMCPADDSHLTMEFDDYFVIKPSITFFDRDQDYSTSTEGEKGKVVGSGFEYNSGSNDHFMTIEQLKDKFQF